MKDDNFEFCCLSVNLKGVIKEYRFHQQRRWRIDYAFPEIKLAIEIEGGIWIKGRHINPMGFKKDMEKYNALVEFGWYLLRYEPKKIDYSQIKRVYEKLKNDKAI
jgi:very-short-patch-repair endonuclease